jgi:hypothetical protein
MRSNSTLPRTPLYSGLAVTVSAAISAGLGFAVVYVLNRSILPAALVPTSAAGVGLVAGFFARWSLTGRSRVVRWLVALVGLCAGLTFLGWLSRGLLGVNLLRRAFVQPDWNGLGQLALGGFAAWLAVYAWSRRPATSRAPAFSLGRASAQLRSSIGSRLRLWRDAASSIVLPSRPPTSPARGRPAGRPRAARKTAARRTRTARSNKARRKTARTSKPKGTRQPRAAVRLLEAVEHRCPYCLELVNPKDPKGVKECPICHTLHHADCWAVTGACQVPHHHE